MKEDNDTEEDPDENDMERNMAQAIVMEKPNIKFSDIAGLQQAKQFLKETLFLPMQFPNFFKEKNLQPWRGILLYGPPGTGKTHIAKACATECKSTVFSISSSDLISKYVGESERLIKALFSLAKKKKPSIIFIDEIDAVASARSDGKHIFMLFKFT